VKKRNILLIVAIFLALLVVAGGGYLVYNKILKTYVLIELQKKIQIGMMRKKNKQWRLIRIVN